MPCWQWGIFIVGRAIAAPIASARGLCSERFASEVVGPAVTEIARLGRDRTGCSHIGAGSCRGCSRVVDPMRGTPYLRGRNFQGRRAVFCENSVTPALGQSSIGKSRAGVFTFEPTKAGGGRCEW